MGKRWPVAIAFLSLWAGGMAAGQGALERVMGVVTALAADRVELSTTDGRQLAIRFDAQTRFERGGAAATASDLKPALRVVVEAENVGSHWTARRVRLGVAAPLAGPAADPEPPAAPPAEGHLGHPDTASGPTLFQSDMTLMAGMRPHDPMAGLSMPRWTWMLLGVGRLGLNDQAGPAGEESFESANWAMAMTQRDLGRGRLTLMAMGSLEPATVPDAGSPQLFQVGETYQGRLLVDRQHPHELIMNLSATYRHPLAANTALWAQAAPLGEPALGPVAFMHRASSGENPSSPLGHHWQDSTHIANNVLTVGGGWRWISLEASAFHGAEPDEDRWDIDGGAPDSLAGRLRLLLPAGWSAQVSHAFLNEPEALEPGDLRRTTASLHYGAEGDRPFAASFVWGRNRETHGTTDAYLLEGAWQRTGGDHFYARAEQVPREPALLLSKGIDLDRFGHLHGGPGAASQRQQISVQALTLGYLKDIPLWRGLKTGLGADLTLYRFPDLLRSAYGDTPVSAHVLLRVRWEKGHAHSAGKGAPVERLERPPGGRAAEPTREQVERDFLEGGELWRAEAAAAPVHRH